MCSLRSCAEQEAKNAEMLAKALQQRNDAYVPAIRHDLSTKRVLTMEFVHGTHVSDIASLKSQGMDLIHVGDTISTVFGEMVFCHGIVHCDPHPGDNNPVAFYAATFRPSFQRGGRVSCRKFDGSQESRWFAASGGCSLIASPRHQGTCRNVVCIMAGNTGSWHVPPADPTISNDVLSVVASLHHSGSAAFGFVPSFALI
jgi:ABC1 atypical kinase-like domain